MSNDATQQERLAAIEADIISRIFIEWSDETFQWRYALDDNEPEGAFDTLEDVIAEALANEPSDESEAIDAARSAGEETKA